MSPLSPLIALLTVCAPLIAQETEDPKIGEDPLEGHSHQGEAFNEGPRQAAYLMGNPARIDFPVETESPEAQAFFTQAVGQLHGFWYFEAERSFRQVAAIDPACAMAYWGMAMANVDNEERAAAFCREAWLRRDGADERGREHIDALAEYYDVDYPVEEEAKRAERKEKEQEKEKSEDNQPKKKTTRRRNYIQALEEILWDHPDDIETKALLVNFLWMSRSRDLPTTSRAAIEALLQQIFEVEPMHPAHHYRIHLWDSKETAKRVVASAVNAGHSWPRVAHQWHMGGHIFDKLGRHADAAWQQEASARVDHAHLMRDRVLPDQIHNFSHNNEWLVRSMRHSGRMHDAIDLAKNMIELPRHPEWNMLDKRGCSASFGRRRLLEVLELYEQWETLVQLADTMYLEPSEAAADEATRAFMLGEALAFLGRYDAAREQVDGLDRLMAQEKAARAESVDRAESEALSEEKKTEEVREAMQTALRKHESTLKGLRSKIESLEGLVLVLETEPIGAIVAVASEEDSEETEEPEYDEQVTAALKALGKGPLPKEHLSRIHLRLGLLEKAQSLARDAVKKKDGIAVPRANLAYVLDAMGEREEALQVFEDMRADSARFDLDAPPFARLAALALAGEYEADWRVHFEEPGDVGNRPALDSLGPRRWSPPEAIAWTCPDDAGVERSLSDYAGKPVVVILFLGFGCLHCVEQLEAFAPAAADFEAAGISIVAIGTDSHEEVAESLATMDASERPPFTILADPEHEVFHAYRSYDDFEDLPLHGTFLIDARGKVRWQDVSFEPFVDHEFLLAESQRLLGLPSSTTTAFSGVPAEASAGGGQ